MTRPPPLGPTAVLVAVPAHDEADRIGTCLESVRAALELAVLTGAVTRARVAVSAHRCLDATARAARAAMGSPRVEFFVREDEEPGPVGAVRRRLVRAARAGWSLSWAEHEGAWLFSTDADTVVPPTWVADLLGVARRERAHGVAGLVDVEGWQAGTDARATYDGLLRAGLHPGGGHTHVYAANLAVQLHAYDTVGGFPAPAHGEEHGLVARLRAAGYRVATPRDVVVTTSGRTPGRAAGGLGDLLTRLAGQGGLGT